MRTTCWPWPCGTFWDSGSADAKQIAHAVRTHWAIENALHWTLDVVFNEDASRVRTDHAPQNMATIRHAALNLLNCAKKHHFKGSSIQGCPIKNKMVIRHQSR